MQKINTLIATAILLLASGCSNNEPSPPLDSSTTGTTNSHIITKEEALASLADFLNDDNSRAENSIPNIREIYSVSYGVAASRSNNSVDINCENLLYVANFEDEQGYAIMAADDRIPERIIAIGDNGTLNQGLFEKNLIDEDRPVYSNYPTSGPGFFKVPEYPEELFINPNTVNLYDASVDDTLVGNFDENEVYEKNLPNSTQSDDSNGQYIASLCMNYASSEIVDYHFRRNDSLNEGVIGEGGSSGSSDSYDRIETKYGVWSVSAHIEPMLTQYKRWKQGEPFNNNYPKRRKYLLFGRSKKASAGCFPLAIAKIMAYFEFPQIYTHNGFTIDWASLKQGNIPETELGILSAAHLLHSISMGCSSIYFYAGTFTFPGNATGYMKLVGYNSARSYRYNFQRVKEMIDKGCPTIAYASPGIRIDKSHSWNIDGYKIKSREVTYTKYMGTLAKSSETKTQTYEMVHCDFGWQGRYNGYYISGIFNLKKLGEVELDNPTGNNGHNENYGTYLHMIYYERPY